MIAAVTNIPSAFCRKIRETVNDSDTLSRVITAIASAAFISLSTYALVTRMAISVIAAYVAAASGFTILFHTVRHTSFNFEIHKDQDAAKAEADLEELQTRFGRFLQDHDARKTELDNLKADFTATTDALNDEISRLKNEIEDYNVLLDPTSNSGKKKTKKIKKPKTQVITP